MDYRVHVILQARILQWVTYPFSSGSSQLRNWTRVSGIAGRFFADWAFRESHFFFTWWVVSFPKAIYYDRTEQTCQGEKRKSICSGSWWPWMDSGWTTKGSALEPCIPHLLLPSSACPPQRFKASFLSALSLCFLRKYHSITQLIVMCVLGAMKKNDSRGISNTHVGSCSGLCICFGQERACWDVRNSLYSLSFFFFLMWTI